GTTGEEIVSTFPTDETVTMSLSNPVLLPGFLQTLEGTKPGQSVIVAMSPEDAFGEQGNPQLGIGPADTVVFDLEVAEARAPRTLDAATPGQSFLVAMSPEAAFGEQGNPQLGIGPADTVVFSIEVVEATTPLTQAEGEEVDPVEGLPTVEADGTSPAKITIPEGEEPPSELVAQPLIKGEGPELAAGRQVRMHYTGVKWSDGSQFDTSLQEGREAFETALGQGQVIAGWDEGLIGQTVGSRVLLVIPPDKGYGASEGHELQDETLVFVVDILAAQ